MNWKDRLKNDLEGILGEPDPRARLSAYHDMPYAIFHYPPEDEFDLRGELDLLATRLENKGKRVTRVSLAECLFDAIAAEGYSAQDMLENEPVTGVHTLVDTVHSFLESSRPLVELVAARLPSERPRRPVLPRRNGRSHRPPLHGRPRPGLQLPPPHLLTCHATHQGTARP